MYFLKQKWYFFRPEGILTSLSTRSH